VKTVAAALEIHPFMLSKWRKDVRDGLIRGRASSASPPGLTREVAQLHALEKAHAVLREEHALLLLAPRRRQSGVSQTTSRQLLDSVSRICALPATITGCKWRTICGPPASS
jgi:transposase